MRDYAPLVEAWIQSSARSGSPQTRKLYGLLIRRWLRGRDPATAGPIDVQRFIWEPWTNADGFQQETKPSTVGVRLTILRSFYAYARRMGELERDPTLPVTRPMSEPARPRGLTLEETRRLLSVIPATALRDRAVILTLLWTGYRRFEAASLTRSSITIEEGGRIMATCKVKGGWMRRREIPPPAWQAIKEHLESTGRDLDHLHPDERLFGLGMYAVSHLVQRYARAAGLDVSPHVLRHTAAKIRRARGATLDQVKRLLGHKRLSTTDRYLAQLEGEGDSGWHAIADLLGDRRRTSKPVPLERRKPKREPDPKSKN